MPRPITKADLRKLDPHSVHISHDDVLGIIVIIVKNPTFCSYSVDRFGEFKWCSQKTLERRKRIGHPKPRKKKQILREPEFGLDEIALAERIISQMD